MSNLSHTNESDYAELDAMMGFDPSNTQIFNASDGSVEPERGTGRSSSFP